MVQRYRILVNYCGNKTIKYRCTYFMRAIPNISQNLKRLEKASGITLSNTFSMVMNAMAWRENYSDY